MSRKECGHHEAERRRVRRVILIGGSSLMVVILMAILVVFLILRPTKPQFRLEDATLYSFNLTPYTNTLSLTMQVTLSAHNPNARIAVYYHSLRLHAAYRAHQISLPTALPDTYQPRRDFTLWSPFLYASALPLPLPPRLPPPRPHPHAHPHTHRSPQLEGSHLGLRTLPPPCQLPRLHQPRRRPRRRRAAQASPLAKLHRRCLGLWVIHEDGDD
ncbi:hypothetical protein Fmac_021845 [Flemingia macrophylla]|uniref:Late embryogenesis abundant protein LEA-2 subgroup domain-containing protein n=1 Tax=Flemingia macrophylla TaxID=520843 RepID=A0ABD1LY33_9FABA